VRLRTDDCWRAVRGADHGVLCTSNPQRRIDAVPVCFAVVSETIVTPVDRVKPKRTTELGRLRNLERDATATLLCERWDPDDWSRLWWVRAHLVRRPDCDITGGQRTEGEHALRAKYPQYEEMEFAHVVHLEVKELVGWSAAADPEAEPGGGLSLR
jgi:PPOX class probable F420-dependent enzyme